ncbi:hypothetical protein [Legionella qingyii]|nr:hypothetical protein [Legionella qingyii]
MAMLRVCKAIVPHLVSINVLNVPDVGLVHVGVDIDGPIVNEEQT